MTVTEPDRPITPKPDYAGIANADDYVLAVDFSGTAENVGAYLVAIDGVTSHAATLEGTTSDKTTCTAAPLPARPPPNGPSRWPGTAFLGDRIPGGAACPQHEIRQRRRRGAALRVFLHADRQGEQGKVTIQVGDDTAGEAGASATFSATLTAFGEPAGVHLHGCARPASAPASRVNHPPAAWMQAGEYFRRNLC